MKLRTFTLLLSFIAFIALGLPDAMLGIAWPFLRQDIDQPLEALGIVVMFGTMGAAASGLVSGPISKRLGIGKVLALSCLITGFSLLGFTFSPSLLAIIVCAVSIGIAAGATDASVNEYVATHFSDRMMQWLHASFGIGVTVGPAILTFVLAQQWDWSIGYWIQATLQLLLAGLFLATASAWWHLPAVTAKENPQAETMVLPMSQSLINPRVWLSIALFFFYCGLEYSVGLWTFSLLVDMREASAAQAGTWVSIYWAMFTVGRIVMGFATVHFPVQRLIWFGILLSLAGALLFSISNLLMVNLLALVAIGFAYAPIYPALVSMTEQRVGREHLTNVMGLQVSGAAMGIVIVPAVIGFVAARTSLLVYPWILVALTLALMACFKVSMHRYS